jgi:protein-S-isoprenylcysteine O-methyltransferase Ste14
MVEESMGLVLIIAIVINILVLILSSAYGLFFKIKYTPFSVERRLLILMILIALVLLYIFDKNIDFTPLLIISGTIYVGIAIMRSFLFRTN